MMNLRKIIFWGCLAAVVYFGLSYHIIFVGSKVKLLKKSTLTLDYTFFSLQAKSNESILAIDALRKDGIGPLLVKMGRLTQEELEHLTAKVEESKKATR